MSALDDDGSTRIGVVFRPQTPPEELVAAARTAEDHGVDELWLWEDCFLESGIASAVAALSATERIRVGVGLLPVPLRNVAVTAMELATVSRLFTGRFVPAMGHGVQEWMEQVGARVGSPLTLLREYVEALRALLAGETVTGQGRYVRLRDVALDWPPLVVPPVLVGAVGPKTLQLSGAVADGTVLTAGTTPDQVRTAGEQIAAGRGADSPARHRVVVYLAAAFGAGAEERLAAETQHWGWDPAADVVVHGDPAEVAAAVRRWVDAGADSVVLQPSAEEPDLPGFLAAAGTVAGLVRDQGQTAR